MIKAYGHFIQAIDRLRSATQLQDISRRNAEIESARGMLFEALADYNNPLLLAENSAPGLLRRQECTWTIEQTIIATYQMQGELSVVSDRLSSLQTKIRTNIIKVIESCETQDEMDFLFPEIHRLRHHDLVVLESWFNRNEWLRMLPSNELKLLEESEFETTEDSQNTSDRTLSSTISEPAELTIYQDFQKKSHYLALRDQLLFMMDGELRHSAERYINQRATTSGRTVFSPSNLQQASDLTIANLYWYFKMSDEEAA
jgi:hypothetical protein